MIRLNFLNDLEELRSIASHAFVKRRSAVRVRSSAPFKGSIKNKASATYHCPIYSNRVGSSPLIGSIKK